MKPQFLRRIVIGLVGGGALLAALLVALQQPFAASRFEFGKPQRFTGVIRSGAYPTLETLEGETLLVDSGKQGAQESIQPFVNKGVHFSGTRIQRGRDAMIEIVPGSMQPVAGGDAQKRSTPGEAPAIDLQGLTLPSLLRSPNFTAAAEVYLFGEIVDSKCYLGVMNPGNGKVHRDCAARCISGGIPAAFIVNDTNGRARVFLLQDWVGLPLREEVLPYVGEPMHLRGIAGVQGGYHVLRSDPRTWKHLE